jgi:hypothetical protein
MIICKSKSYAQLLIIIQNSHQQKLFKMKCRPAESRENNCNFHIFLPLPCQEIFSNQPMNLCFTLKNVSLFHEINIIARVYYMFDI